MNNDYKDGWNMTQLFLQHKPKYRSSRIKGYMEGLVDGSNSSNRNKEFRRGRLECYKQHLMLRLLENKDEL